MLNKWREKHLNSSKVETEKRNLEDLQLGEKLHNLQNNPEFKALVEHCLKKFKRWRYELMNIRQEENSDTVSMKYFELKGKLAALTEIDKDLQRLITVYESQEEDEDSKTVEPTN